MMSAAIFCVMAAWNAVEKSGSAPCTCKERSSSFRVPATDVYSLKPTIDEGLSWCQSTPIRLRLGRTSFSNSRRLPLICLGRFRIAPIKMLLFGIYLISSTKLLSKDCITSYCFALG